MLQYGRYYRCKPCCNVSRANQQIGPYRGLRERYRDTLHLRHSYSSILWHVYWLKVTKSASATPQTMRHAIEMRRKTIGRTVSSSKVHDNFQSAVDSRIRTVASFPGKQYLHAEAAAAIVARYDYDIWSRMDCKSSPSALLRATLPVDFPERAEEQDSSATPGRLQFRHDPRLLLPNDVYLTPEQVS